MQTTFTIEIPFLEDGESKTRLLTPAERRTLSRRADEADAAGQAERAESMRTLVAASESAETADGAAVRHWRAEFRLPSYRDGIGIKAVAMAEARGWAAEAGVELTNAVLAAFTAEARAKVLCRSVCDETGASLGGFDAIPEGWRSEVADLVELATSLSEDERVPLFGGPAGAPTT